MKRRRFIQIMAACAFGPAPAHATLPDWQGTGFGADLSLHLTGAGDRRAVLAALPLLIAAIEAEFSLYRADSALSRLNRSGLLDQPSGMFRAVVELSTLVHGLTDGIFDPSVQAIWQAYAKGHGRDTARIGWSQVGWGDTITLPHGMALTFNGVAQGFAADAVCHLLSAHGFHSALVNMGELAAMGGPYRVGIADPDFGILAERQLSGGAIATSSLAATMVNGHPHLIHPANLPPQFSTVSVEADTAALADAISTAAVLMPQDRLAQLLAKMPQVRRMVLVKDGNLTTLER